MPVLYWCIFLEPGINRSPHSGHLMWSESTRDSFSGGIEYPHFGQRLLSDAFTLSRLIFCFWGIGAGGEGGIRTPDTLSGMPVFKTGAINRSATSPSHTFTKANTFRTCMVSLQQGR